MLFTYKQAERLFRLYLYGLGYPRQLFPWGKFTERCCENVFPVGRVVFSLGHSIRRVLPIQFSLLSFFLFKSKNYMTLATPRVFSVKRAKVFI